jgi:hypothetical protein
MFISYFGFLLTPHNQLLSLLTLLEQREYPILKLMCYVLVAENMVHGPCGNFNVSAPCMKNGACSKGYPKDF